MSEDATPPGEVQPEETAQERKSVTVSGMFEDSAVAVALELAGGASGVDRKILGTRIQKSGLALAGHFYGIDPSRIQILGMTEITYLRGLDPAECEATIQRFFERELCCVVVSEADSAFPDDLVSQLLIAAADREEVALLTSKERSSTTILALHAWLDERLAPRMRMHGVLVDVFEVGLLLLGSSGVGKSEVALELIMRGHRLVADDVVECLYRPPGMVFGSAADLLRHHLEVRGLGILNVKDLFGVTAVRDRKRVDVVVQLVARDPEDEVDRLGLEERFHEILGVDVRELLIQVRPGRDIASILEIAARNELLKQAGHHPAREFFGRLEGALLGHDSEVPSAGAVRRPSIPKHPRAVAPAPAAPESSVGMFLPPIKK